MADFVIFPMPQFENWLVSQKVTRLIRLVQIHHTWKPNYTSFEHSDHMSLLEGMEKSHLERGFTDIAQHFTTFPDGLVGTGRPLNQVPAGIKGANKNGVCIENLGNFDIGGDNMTEIQKKAIIKVTSLLCKKFALVPSEEAIVYHHWYDLITGVRTNGTGSTKTCPGTNFFGGNTIQDFNANFLPLVQNEIGEMQVAPNNGYLFAGMVTAGKLNVRAGASLNAPIVDKVTKGTELRIFSESYDWYSVNSSYTRWVKKEFIEIVNT
jgi:hypothetical protein